MFYVSFCLGTLIDGCVVGGRLVGWSIGWAEGLCTYIYVRMYVFLYICVNTSHIVITNYD